MNNTIEIKNKNCGKPPWYHKPQWRDIKTMFLLHRTSWFSKGVTHGYNLKFHKINGDSPFFHSLWPIPLASWQLHQRHDGPSLRSTSETTRSGNHHESRRTFSRTKAIYQNHKQRESLPILGQNYTLLIRANHFGTVPRASNCAWGHWI